MLKKIAFSLVTLIGFSTTSMAQGGFAHEIGVIFGPVTFQSDYGERHDLDTNLGNTGFGIGVTHYLNFSANNNRDRFFSEHFKVRSELSFSKTNLQHFGEWVEKDPARLGVQQLKAMRGSSTVFNLGSQLEFSPFMKIHDFENTIGAFSPYVSLGFLVSYYKSHVGSDLGQLGTPDTTFPKYLTPSDGHQFGFSSENGVVLSATAGLGAHYKIADMHDIMVEARFQMFSSDWVDGLNPNKDIYTENKNNDWQVWFNVGYIYYLEF
ncbi:glutamate dehydrogenase [Flavobacterium sp. Fl-77]|uniref:Glutamate dehydrogenase n=1 Tax=Flavobacterium flavipigmentatum TaxID=2893884 RepID=A0AAJ2S694_9FLAO|nr:MULTISPECIES: glutamate dehydrogenase [unclassified Flavobacterium]MDX6180722.1 glutamate dehydrogenase [Flavobacterium sp. Fl-33]MDX6184322.1 glutamate dehydrogenase [Flavobacterium sp. Fl-77]UFH39432.1 glutamate dehydrogenase [Flavobacterium sp. F-70]